MDRFAHREIDDGYHLLTLCSTKQMMLVIKVMRKEAVIKSDKYMHEVGSLFGQNAG